MHLCIIGEHRFLNQIFTYVYLTHRIQAIDGGFFEKFGMLLRQRSEKAEELELDSAHLVTDSVSLRTIEEAENDSGTETLHDTDSEPEDQHSKQEELIEECTGLNVSTDEIEMTANTLNGT